MTTFRVTYRREKPAGAIQFDPTIEFVDFVDLNVNTAEEATLQYVNQKPYVKIERVERMPTGMVLGTQSVSTSGATSTWIGMPQASTNVSRVGGTIEAFVFDSNAGKVVVDVLRGLGVDETTLEPLRKNSEIMENKAQSELTKLVSALKTKDESGLRELAEQSEQNGKRGLLANQIVRTLVDCNIYGQKMLTQELFKISPETVNELHTACTNQDEFQMKIGALAVVFETNLEHLKTKVKNAQDSWKSIKLIEEWCKQSKTLDPKVFNVWRSIVDLRNATFPYHPTDSRIVELISFFGEKFPPNYTQLWNVILGKFHESIAKFSRMLSRMETNQ